MLVTLVILTKFTDFVVLAKMAIVAIFPNVATAGIEERVVTAAIRELDMAEVSIRHDGLGLKDWFQCEHRKKQRDEREDRLCVKVNAHVSASNSGIFISLPNRDEYTPNYFRPIPSVASFVARPSLAIRP
jgi:hypothetical protein